MRRLFFLIFFVTSAALAQETYTVGAHSDHHAVEVRHTQGQYDITVIEVPTNHMVAEMNVRDDQQLLRSAAEKDAVIYSVRLSRVGSSLSFEFSVQKEALVVDTIHASFTIGRPLNSAGAVRVGGDVRAPIVIRRVEPVYSEAARKAGISGTVILECVIDKNGLVRDAVVLKEQPQGLSEAALEAVKQWEFQPATMNGNPVDVIYNITISFLPGSPKQ